MSDIAKITCVSHGNEIDETNFYLSGESSIYSGIGRIPICKKCLEKMVMEYYAIYKNHKAAIYYTLRKLDVGFDMGFLNGALKRGDNSYSILQYYMTQRNSLGTSNSTMLNFDEGEHPFSGVDDDEDGELFTDMPLIQMTQEDYRNQKEVIELLGYDPFEGYSEADQKSLYSDLINYLDDEEIVEDQFLVSQIIQVVINNEQIRKLNFNINRYMSTPKTMLEFEGKIKSLSKMKGDIVSSTDKIAKENAITVKGRGGGRNKKASITMLMQTLRDIDLKDAEVSFYDQRKAYGMQVAADISMKAMSEQIQFDENDVNDIITMQRDMIKNMEQKIMDLEEENRLLNLELVEEVEEENKDNVTKGAQ